MSAPSHSSPAPRPGFAPSPDLRPLRGDFWAEVFGNDRPVVIEIGPGRGETLLRSACDDRQRNFFAIERSHSLARALEQRLGDLGLLNARVITADAQCVLTLLPDSCVTRYVVQFPDPWWKRRHWRRRLWTGEFLQQVVRTLITGAEIELVTDVADYFERAQRILDETDALELVWRGSSEELLTNFARKAGRHGVTIQRSVHRRR